jgi:curli production assembly/transport component CsgF
MVGRMIGMVAVAMLVGGTAQAGNLKYQPVDPALGGFPSNGPFLLESATAQNKYAAQASRSSGITNQTPAQEFAESFQRRLLLSMSDKITDAIFGEKAQPEGTFELEGTVIQFHRVGNNVDLTINDGVNTTRVVVPVAF